MILPGPLTTMEVPCATHCLHTLLYVAVQAQIVVSGQKIRKVLRLLGGSRRYLANLELKRRSFTVLPRPRRSFRCMKAKRLPDARLIGIGTAGTLPDSGFPTARLAAQPERQPRQYEPRRY